MDGDVTPDVEPIKTPKRRLLFLACAAAVGLWMGLVQSAHSPKPAVSAPGLYHTLTQLGRAANQPISLAIVATAIILLQVRQRFQGWRGILSIWIASGMLGSVAGHYLSK
jgi:hypothetical protein